VRAYLAMTFAQWRPGGRPFVRDVVGPEMADHEVQVVPGAYDGKDLSADAVIRCGFPTRRQDRPGWPQEAMSFTCLYSGSTGLIGRGRYVIL